MIHFPVWFRYHPKNSYSIAALLPLVEADLARQPKDGIMLYSFATAQAKEVYAEVDRARAFGAAQAVYIAGGPHPSALPEEALQHFDFVVIGEGEECLPQLIRALESGSDPAAVKGIAFKRQGRVLFTGSREPVDLDLYPPFSRILAPIEISRGCPWGCTYCQTPRLFGFCMRHRSIEVIERYARRHKDIRFTSPNALAYGSDGRRPRMEKVEALLLALWKQKKPIYFGTFPSEVRPDFLTEKALELITRYCANKSLSLGGQSGSPTVLCRIGRGHGREEIEAACDLALEFGLTPQVDFIFGLPQESEEEQRQTLDLVRWIVAKKGKVRAHRFTPLPGTPLWGELPAPLAGEVEACLGRLALEGRVTGSWSASKDKTA
ncbi:MAG TPA: TIGR04013 family B12-binding domain/radical SAM domain-containing protein [Methanothrix sp.]|nr:TIGR04013 family B12-binding domain/radical SAM domain-containing protein [Methanothrix sp.]HQJ78902.1 TIGR04013 family B12-binding domain/radical SAM domain-containing protein [Methanothrix sp.]